MKKINLIFVLMIVLTVFIPPAQGADLGPIPEKLPVPGLVNVIDLGATKCIPCKMMAPILKELQKEYKGQAAIVFLDVREHPPWAKQFAIKAIPTQIFFDKNGREIFRHEGFFDKKSIAAKIEEIKAGQGQEKAPLTVDDLPIKDQATLVMVDDSLKNKRDLQKHLDLLQRVQMVFPESVFVVFVDRIKNPDIVTKFKIETSPSLLFFDSSGRELHRTDQVPDLKQVVSVFESAGIKPAIDLNPTIPANDRPTLLCLGDPKVMPQEKLLPLLNEVQTKYRGKLAVFQAYSDKHPELAEKYKVEKYPAFIFFDAQGLEKYRQYGVMSLEEIDVQLKKIGLEQ